MPCYETRYTSAGGGRQRAWVWASSMRLAIKHVIRRNLRERFVVNRWHEQRPEVLAPEHRPLTAAEVMESRVAYNDRDRQHALMFLALLALKSGAATVDEIHDDDIGILHRYAHHKYGSLGDAGYKRLVRDVRRLE